MLGFDALAKIPLSSLPQAGAVDTTGTAAGVATVTGAIEAVKDFVGTAAGLATVSGAIEAIRQGAGAAAGVATVVGVIEALTGVDHTAAGLAIGSATATAIGQAATKLSRDITAPGFDLAGNDVAIASLTGLPVVLTRCRTRLGARRRGFRDGGMPQATAVTAAKPANTRSTNVFQ